MRGPWFGAWVRGLGGLTAPTQPCEIATQSRGRHCLVMLMGGCLV